MTDVTERSSRSHLAIPVLLALMLLAQIGIANEIRYQGCVARVYDALALSGEEAADVQAALREHDCKRTPLL